MNLLHVVHYPVFGGPHNQALRLDRPLREQGWNTTVLTPPGNAAVRLEEAGVDVIQAPLARLRASLNPWRHGWYAARFPTDVRTIRRIIRERGIDLVVLAGLVNPQAAIAARQEGVPVVWQLLDTRAPMMLRRALMPLVLRWSDAVMTTGRGLAAQHPGARQLGRRLIPFYPPVDCQEFRPMPELRTSVRRAWGIDEHELALVAVGNLNPQKGIEYLIDALAEVRHEGLPARLVLVGAEHETQRSYSAGLRSRLRHLGLEEGHEVIFTGPSSLVYEQLQGADVFVMGSVPRSEGAPTAIIEALACGKPVVATDVGAVRELVQDGLTGYVVEPLSGSALAEGIVRTLERGPETFAEDCRSEALARFDIHACVEAHLRAFDTAMASRIPALRS